MHHQIVIIKLPHLHHNLLSDGTKTYYSFYSDFTRGKSANLLSFSTRAFLSWYRFRDSPLTYIKRNSTNIGRGKAIYKPLDAHNKMSKRKRKALMSHIKLIINRSLNSRILSILSDSTKGWGPDEVIGYLKFLKY